MLAGYISIYIYRIKRYFLLQLNLKYCTQFKFKPTHGMTKKFNYKVDSYRNYLKWNYIIGDNLSSTSTHR